MSAPAHTHDETTRILRARARNLALTPAPATDAQTILELIEFNLAGERYALETRYVREVHPLENLTPIPCTPLFVRGLVNIRGRIVPVIDLKKFLDLPESGITDLHRILLLRADDMEFGILADTIACLRAIPLESLQPTLPTLAGIRAQYLKGVTPDRLVVLDAARILADPGIIVREEIET